MLKTSLIPMLTKEIIQIKHSVISWLFIIPVLTIICSAIFQPNGIIIYILFVSFIETAYCCIMNDDVNSRWNIFSVTFPSGRSAVIRSKYILASFYELVYITALGIGIIIWCRFSGKAEYSYNDILEYLGIISTMLLCGSLTLTLIFKKGSFYGGRIAYILNIVIFVAFIFVFAGFRALAEKAGYPLYFTIAAAIITVLLILRYLSYKLSLKYYSKRDL